MLGIENIKIIKKYYLSKAHGLAHALANNQDAKRVHCREDEKITLKSRGGKYIFYLGI